MEPMDSDSGYPDYHTVYTALEEFNLAFLKPFFKKHCLEDETLNLMKSEEELKSELAEKLGLPYGQAFKFSRNWFQKYHKHKGATIIHSQKESKNVCGSTVKINTGDGFWGHIGTSKNQTEESKSYHGPNEILNLAEHQEKSTKLTFDKVDISEMQKENRGLSINSLMMEKGAVIQDYPFNDLEEPVTSQGLKFKQDARVQKACQNANIDAGFEVLKEDFVNQETKKTFKDEQSSRQDELTVRVNEGVFATTTIGETIPDPNTEGTSIHCQPSGITGDIPENHQRNDTVCDSQDSVNRSKGKESQKDHSKDSLRISLEHQPPTEANICFSAVEESRLKKNGTPNGTDETPTLVRTPSADKLHPYIEKTSGELSLSTNSRYADTVIATFSSPLMSSHSSVRQNDDLLPIQQHGDTTETSNVNKMPAVRSEEVSPKCKRRKFGTKVEEDFFYQQGSVLDAQEDREVEFKSLAGASPGSLRWKIMEKAKKFICGCLNADRKGIIYFGVADSQEQGSKFRRGEIIGLDVENIKDDINKAFQDVLDHHIKSEDRLLQKGGEQNCVNIYFIPVKSTQNSIDLHVIEIEVARDFLYCKDNVYYYKVWTEKSDSRDCSGKTGLRDFFKVKDEVEAAIRTNGVTCCVKPNEVKWQIRDPLSTKYKEWKRDVKSGGSCLTSDGLSTNNSDLQKFSSIVRERLRDLNLQEYHYILVANKLPPEYRGTSKLSFLQNIPWVAVFDLFDAASKEDGLYFSCNEVGDGARANIKTLHDFKDVSSGSIGDKDCPLSLRGTTWILKESNRMEEEDWITCSKDCLYQTLTACKQSFPSGRLIFVFLGFAENAVLEMSDIAESCFSILGGEIASKSVTIISENKTVADAFIKASKSPLVRKQLRECAITGISWDLLKEIVKEMVGPLEFQERGATTKLPHIAGLKEILNKVINSWVDLEVYCPEPQDRLPRLTKDIEKVRDAFYKGAQCNQVNLFHDHSIQRTLEEEITRKIDQALNSLSEARGDRNCYVKTVTIPYEPGSGATTLCRRILWKKRKACRCALVKAITASTEFQIKELQSKGYERMKSNYSLPVLVLIDNFPQIDTQRLSKSLTSMETKCVILSTVPIEKSGPDLYFDIKPLKQLDPNETQLVKNILMNITKDSEKRKKGEEVLEREKRFIWFGLELFGRKYVKIEQRLQNHIDSTLATLGSSHSLHEKLLNFCCFLHFYSNSRYILPHPLVVDLLYKESSDGEEKRQRKDLIHDLFGGLLLEGFDETHGYSGWQPAHYLVSEVVKSKMDVEEIALQLLENAEEGVAYVNKFLRQQLFQIFLDRKRISEPVCLSKERGTDDDIIGSDIETDPFGFYEVRTRYSPLILDIKAQDDGNHRTLKFLIATCQKANQTEYKAYAWQQLARFMGYEMRSEELKRADFLHELLYNAMIESKVGEIRFSRPKTGIEAAHIAVDIAINQQPSYSHHYTTKGVLYVLQLRDYNDQDGTSLVSHLPDVIHVCRNALEVYDQAIKMMQSLNYYSMIGKIQVIVLLLKIVKGLPCFLLDSNLLSRYLNREEIPKGMKEVLLPDDHKYVQGLSRTTLDLLNKLFGDFKYRQLTTYDENEMNGIRSALIRACKLRRQFYEITEFDRSGLVDVKLPLSPVLKGAPDLLPQIVQDTLFKRRETLYSGWSNLDDEVVSSIYRLLKPVCLKDNGNHDDMVIFSRACLRLRSEEKPPVKELDDVVQNWVQRFPDSEWAHLFNCMIHFPLPNGSLAPYGSKTLASVKECRRIAEEKTNWKVRHSGAEYFLGKGKGLSAIVSSQRFPTLERKGKSKTHFWRSREVSDVLLRVRGQKEAKGIIIYHGIKLRFDNMLYPKPSRDNLWFYVGFSVTGPYAFDPIDEDTYSTLNGDLEEKEQMNEMSTGGSNANCNIVSSTVNQNGNEAIDSESNAQGNSILMKEEAFNFPKVTGCKPTDTKAPTEYHVSGDSHVVPGNMSSWAKSEAPPSTLPKVSVREFRIMSAETASPSYATVVKYGVDDGEKESVESYKSPSVAAPAMSQTVSRLKTVTGTKGQKKRKFQPTGIDDKGKLHHGVLVLGKYKSKECKIHTNSSSQLHDIDRCTFAHSWRGDTCQFVCTKCTQDEKEVCRQRKDHKRFIWNLGPYLNEDGRIWEESCP